MINTGLRLAVYIWKNHNQFSEKTKADIILLEFNKLLSKQSAGAYRDEWGSLLMLMMVLGKYTIIITSVFGEMPLQALPSSL